MKEDRPNVKTLASLHFIDTSGYVEGRDQDAGGYKYYIDLYRVDDNYFESEYSTSAYFDYCKIEGRFQDCAVCPYYQAAQCTAKPLLISEEEVQRMINAQTDNFQLARFSQRKLKGYTKS